MTTELAIAIASGLVALASAVLAFVAQTRVVKIQHALSLQRDTIEREQQAKQLVSKYREPLVRAAADLQSRLFNIVQQRFLSIHHARGTADEKRYAVDSTLFVVAEYLGWVEILRREVQLLDLGTMADTRRLAELLEAVSTTFLTGGFAGSGPRSNLGRTFRLFRAEQRAIGELMLVQRSSPTERVFDPIGFTEFSKRIEDPEYRRWFRTVDESIEAIASDIECNEERLIVLQHALVDLIDFLDPEGVRVPRDHRRKISA